MNRSTDQLTTMCMNGTNATTCHVDLLPGLAYSPLFLLGLPINAAALLAFIAKRHSWTDTHMYMFNLAVADFAFTLFLPFRIYNAFYCLPKTTLCSFLLYMHFINMYASIMTVTAISVQRYLVIRFPLQARFWRKKKEAAFAVCLIIWGTLLTICAIFQEENYPENLWTCYERRKNNKLEEHVIGIVICMGFLMPLVIIVFCSSQIICILTKADEKSEQKKMIVYIVTANMIVFIVCYAPIHVAFLINHLNKPPANWECESVPSHVYLLVSEWIAATNCCFDSFGYYFLLKQFYSLKS